jgi:hypothetical protein
MPGITVDKAGTVTAHGEQVKKITVDGKEFFGDDASAALKNLPASVVDKIQVFDKLSDQAQLTGVDDGNSQKSINIITKAGIQNAQFGRMFAGIGNDKRYAAGGNVSFFKNDRRISIVGNFNNTNQQNFGSQDLLGISGNSNNNRGGFSGGGSGGGRGMGMGGFGDQSESFTVGQSNGISSTNALGINYSDKWGSKATIAGSYFFNNSNNDNASTNNNFILQQNQTTFQKTNTNSNNFNHRINARFEYKIDSNNSIFILPNINFQSNNSDRFGLLKSYINVNDSLANSNSSLLSDKSGYNIRNNIMFRHGFAKKGRSFSMGIKTTFTKNDGTSTIDGMYRFYDVNGSAIFPDSLQQQYSDNKTNGETYAGTFTYNEPLDKKAKSQLQFEYTPTIQISKANQKTYGLNGQEYNKLDTLLSNQFKNTITTNVGSISYRLTMNKDEQFVVGLNYQETQLLNDGIFPSITNVNQSYRNLLPNGFWRKKISKSSSFRLFYRASTIFPSISQLQEVVNLSNPLSVSIGDKNLKQSYTQYMGTRYSYTNTKTNRSLFANFFYQTGKDFISNATFITTSDSAIQQGVVIKKGTQLTKPLNLDGFNNLRAFVNYSLPIKFIKSNLNLNGGFQYSNLPGSVNNIITKTQTAQYNFGVNVVSNINEYIDYNISYNANINNVKTLGSSLNNNNYVNHVFAITLNLLSKKGWFVQNDFTGQIYEGLSSGFNQRYSLWNASIGKKFFKNKTGELKISVFDILKQNQSISRNVTNTYIEDVQSNVLQQYFMLTFSYNLKNFGTPKKNPSTEESGHRGGYPGSL